MTWFGRKIRALSALTLMAYPAFVQQPASVAAPQPSEYEVKAAFILNFTRFIEWPPSAAGADGHFTICILGEDPFGKALDEAVAGERVNDRPIVVRRMRQPGRGCEILFFPRSEKGAARVLPETGPGVLTVGETSDFLHFGGMIAFSVENRRVRFDVNQAAVARASLQISSKLLNVARSVER